MQLIALFHSSSVGCHSAILIAIRKLLDQTSPFIALRMAKGSTPTFVAAIKMLFNHLPKKRAWNRKGSNIDRETRLTLSKKRDNLLDALDPGTVDLVSVQFK